MSMMDKKYILIIRQSEPLEVDEKGSRLWRASLIQKYCNDLGLRSIYLASTFSHYDKKQRFNKTTKLSGKGSDTLVLLKTPGYKNNISLVRFFDHLVFGVKVGFYIASEHKNIRTIFVSHPTIEGAFVSSVLGRIFGVKVIIDVRDLWPDTFYDIFGNGIIIKSLLKLVLLPYTLITRITFSLAQNISAPTGSYLKWAKNKSFSKKQKELIKLPFAYPSISQQVKVTSAPSYLSAYKGYKVCVFIGTLNEHMFNFLPIVETVKKFNTKVVFVLAGDGSGKDKLKNFFHNDNNVVFPGWLPNDEILNLMRASDFALAPYVAIDNFEFHVPNKIIEYLSEGLPVIYSVKGEMDILLKDCGFRYDATAKSDSILCLENIVERILLDDILLVKLSSNARTIFVNQFRAEVVYKNFITSFL
jgi:glycosyltransferase involved in cell wall biosynthesis